MGVKKSKPVIKREFANQAHYIEKRVLDDAVQNLLNDPARTAHDLNLKHVNDIRFRQCQEFIHACHAVAKWRLEQGELSDDAGHYVGEIMAELSTVVLDLTALGDLMIARRLLPVVDNYQHALGVYGPVICPDGLKRQDIEQILRKHTAKSLLEMIDSLHPNWDTILKIENRREIELLSEKDLRQLLLGKERLTLWHKKTKRVEWRTHRLAELVEHVFAIREAEAARINLFVQFLRRGWLWSLSSEKGKPETGKTFVKCPWHGQNKLPPVGNWLAWKMMIFPFLKTETAGVAGRLSVFRYFLARRKGVYATKEKGRLADDKPAYVWNQVENKIGDAWRRMAKREVKRFLKKTG